MRTIIAGSRDNVVYAHLLAALEEIDWAPSVVISGTARGADTFGERWAGENDVPVERFPADWNTHGKSAGYIRNSEMAQKAEALVALWDGSSKGTMHMINLATKAGLKVHVYNIG